MLFQRFHRYVKHPVRGRNAIIRAMVTFITNKIDFPETGLKYLYGSIASYGFYYTRIAELIAKTQPTPADGRSEIR